MVNKAQNVDFPFVGRTTDKGMLGLPASHRVVKGIREWVTGSTRGHIGEHVTAKRKKAIGMGGRRKRRTKRRRCRKHRRRHKCRTRHRRRHRRTRKKRQKGKGFNCKRFSDNKKGTGVRVRQTFNMREGPAGKGHVPIQLFYDKNDLCIKVGDRKWQHCGDKSDLSIAVARWIQDNREAGWHPLNKRERKIGGVVWDEYVRWVHFLHAEIRRNEYRGNCHVAEYKRASNIR